MARAGVLNTVRPLLDALEAEYVAVEAALRAELMPEQGRGGALLYQDMGND
jgi:hypothetical protein